MFFEEKQRKNQMAKDKNNLNKNRYLQLKSKSTQFKNDAKKSFIEKQHSELWWGLKENVHNEKQNDRQKQKK